jgi:hypothetical protein
MSSDGLAAVAGGPANLAATRRFLADARKGGICAKVIAILQRAEGSDASCVIAFDQPVSHLGLDLVSFAGSLFLRNVPELVSPVQKAYSRDSLGAKVRVAAAARGRDSDAAGHRQQPRLRPQECKYLGDKTWNALRTSLDKRDSLDMPTRLVDALQCMSAINRLVAAGSAATSALATAWLVDAGADQQQASHSESFRRSTACPPALMPISMTLERDLLDTHVLPKPAQKLLLDSLCLALDPTLDPIPIMCDYSRPLQLAPGADMKFECVSFHMRIRNLYTKCGAAALKRFVVFAMERLDTVLCLELGKLPLPPALRLELEAYVEMLWDKLLFLVSLDALKAGEQLCHMLLATLLDAGMHSAHHRLLRSYTEENNIVNRVEARMLARLGPMLEQITELLREMNEEGEEPAQLQ